MSDHRPEAEPNYRNFCNALESLDLAREQLAQALESGDEHIPWTKFTLAVAATLLTLENPEKFLFHKKTPTHKIRKHIAQALKRR